MGRVVAIAALLVAGGLLLLGWGLLDRDRPARSVPVASPRAEVESPRAGPDRVWVAIDFVDLEAGGSSEYIGQVDRASLDALVDGRLGGYLRLDGVFWLFDDGEVERLDDDLALGDSAYFRVEAIRRVTPVKDGFPEAARQIPPGDRIVPGPGRDA